MEEITTNVQPISSSSNHDYHVMGTAEDALKAKYAAVQSGYYHDPYIASFWNDSTGSRSKHSTTSSTTSAQQQHPLPPVQVIIKRGTYARVACMYKAISVYLDECQSLFQDSSKNTAQVIVIGSGKDTAFFRILDDRRRKIQEADNQSTSQVQHLHWFEVDHDVIVQQKTRVIQKSSVFGSDCHKVSNPDSSYSVTPLFHSEESWPNAEYHLIGHNLNNDPDHLIEKLLHLGMDPSAPTLIVLECVLMYMTKDAATVLLQSFNQKCSDCTMVSYEPILGYDSSFGRVMEENLTKIGVVHPKSCFVEIRTVQQYMQQLYSTVGCQLSVGCDMYTAYETILSTPQRAHAQKCEFLDELEEFILIMQHYCFIVSNNNSNSILGKRMCEIENNKIGFAPGRCEHL
jgi:[phosphatase 2A protein]-leucine-carboxy methyltransferase